MGYWVIAIAAVSVLWLTGCGPVPVTPPAPQPVAERPELAEYVANADEAAKQHIAQLNEIERQRLEGAGGPDSPFKLADYEKSVTTQTTSSGREVVYVAYRHLNPPPIRGGPTHFSIWVYRDTMETRVFAGR